MKKLVFILALILVFSCEKNEPEETHICKHCITVFTDPLDPDFDYSFSSYSCDEALEFYDGRKDTITYSNGKVRYTLTTCTE